MREQAVEVPAALPDHLGEPDDLGTGAHDDQELEAAVVCKISV